MAYPAVSATASLAADNSVTVTLCNTDPAAPADITLTLTGRAPVVSEARLLASADLNTCNTFDHPRAVASRPFDGVRVSGTQVTATLPPGAVASLRFA
jgi:alpha-N-arabinofuranosidase